MLEYLQYFSIFLEAVVAIFGLMIYFKKKRMYGVFIFFTFFIYVMYDLTNFLSLNVPVDAGYLIFFLATLSIFYAVWLLYKGKK